MREVLSILIILIQIYELMLIGRIIVEMIRSFSRNFQAPRWFMIFAEFLFVFTDPPVKFLRRWIPPMRMGNVALDVSILVLFFLLFFIKYAIVAAM